MVYIDSITIDGSFMPLRALKRTRSIALFQRLPLPLTLVSVTALVTRKPRVPVEVIRALIL
jgi:hypothetical protein